MILLHEMFHLKDLYRPEEVNPVHWDNIVCTSHFINIQDISCQGFNVYAEGNCIDTLESAGETASHTVCYLHYI